MGDHSLPDCWYKVLNIQNYYTIHAVMVHKIENAKVKRIFKDALFKERCYTGKCPSCICLLVSVQEKMDMKELYIFSKIYQKHFSECVVQKIRL